MADGYTMTSIVLQHEAMPCERIDLSMNTQRQRQRSVCGAEDHDIITEPLFLKAACSP